ncbi:MAG: DUF2461 domain-containing protein [Betaproteobacteria bacterium]|nr:DUF2461 domain-containing protein [Betaproteobacteria bacterium]
MQTFKGLGEMLPAFLLELGRNNSREWFNAHREEYQHYVAAPLASLAEMLAPDIALLDNSLIKRLSRPQRDTRFSKDKSPFRTQMWFAFRRDLPNWTEYPAFFLEVTSEHCRWGMGYYSARPATMATLRDIAEENQERFLTAMAAATDRGFSLYGDPYKRHPPVPAGIPEEIVALFGRRNVYLSRIMDYDPLLMSSEFASVVSADYAALGAMYHLFRMAAGQLKPASFSLISP